jgi:predicted TIM-barrel fold metal-dependent hydrolase
MAIDMNKLVLVSVDDHVVEPPHLFEGRLPRRFADAAPRVERRADGSQAWLFQGEAAKYIGMNAVAGRPSEEFSLDPSNYEEMRPGCYDIHERVRDMNANGVLASICFPTFPQFAGQYFSRQPDKELALLTIQAYNDWQIEEWSGTYPGRMIPFGILPLWDPELMGKEVRRLAAKGCHAVAFSEGPYKLGYPTLHSGDWDPFFAACATEGTVICTHLGSSSHPASTTPDAPMHVPMVLAPSHLMYYAADMLFSGVFVKFPTLKLALSEGGIGWIPYFLEHADYTYRTHRAWAGSTLGDRVPSEVFREHVITCFIDDAVGIKMRDEIGIDTICWECDYPHSDSTWPRSPERVVEYMADLSEDELAKVTHLNAMRHFQFDPFVSIPRDKATVGALREAEGARDLTFSDGRRSSNIQPTSNTLLEAHNWED